MKRNFITFKTLILTACFLLLLTSIALSGTETKSYTIVDTGLERCYNNIKEIHYPHKGQDFYGQDAQYVSNPPAYRDNGDGTITDLNTGLMWQKTPDFVKRLQPDAEKYANNLKLGGYDDWRVPTIKELFSIADFRGNINTRTPYIDTRYFDFKYPDSKYGPTGPPGNRIIDAQYTSSTHYLGTTMFGDSSVFGFNFADGRIKGYPVFQKRYIRCVRGKTYGKNDFVDNGDGTITDRATGLTWMKNDSGKAMNWQEALKYAENLKLAGRDDWRLPNVKELQSIVDYNRAPDAKDLSKKGPAIDPIFNVTKTESWYWTGTTFTETGGALYVCFGRGMSAWIRNGKQLNAHGAGAVRSDPKFGNPSYWKNGRGPQGDEIRIYNYVRCVRGGDVKTKTSGPALAADNAPMMGPGSSITSRNPHGIPPGASMPSIGTASWGKHFVQRLDKNGDNKVSRNEFDGPPQHFDICDKNNDGYLDSTEAPPPPTNRRI